MKTQFAIFFNLFSMVVRPEFAKILFVFFIASVTGCSSFPKKDFTSSPQLQSKSEAKADSQSPKSDESIFPIIDVHLHPEFTGEREETSQIPITQEQFEKEINEAHVVGGVALQGKDGKGYQNDFEKYRIIRCAGIGKKVDVSRIEQGLKTGYYRCMKIYLGYIHQFASDKNYSPAYRLAEKYGVPVVFHTGDTYSTKGKLKYSDPLTIDEVAVDHPKVKFVIAHCGNPWIQSAAEVAYKNPNVYLDGSAFIIGDLSKKSPESIRKNLIEPVKWIFSYLEDETKLMFGSDWPLVNISQYAKWFKEAIPPEHRKAVFHDNAVKVFQLDKVKK